MYKIEKVVSDIKLHEQKIAKRFFIDSETVKVSGIILQKPFKLQITAIAKVDGKKKKRVRSVEFTGTLKEAIADALQLRKVWKDELKEDILAPTQTTTPKTVTKMLTLSEAFSSYTKAKITEFKSKNKKYDNYRYVKLFEKHIAPVLGDTLLDNIDAEDIQTITNNMKVIRAKLDKEGNKIPIGTYDINNRPRFVMEERPATERTKRTIYQIINPIYSYVNKSNKIKFTVNSPASMSDLPALENDKEVSVTIEAFTELFHYEQERYRNFFIWLMHGRRFGEVASLEYSDIDFDEGTYTIRKENNKARVPMTYKLTQWQLDTLHTGGSGLVFPSVNSSTSRMNSGTLQAHYSLNCTMHDMRHILGNELINNNVGIQVIGKILGHKPDKRNITTRYAKVTPEVASEALVGVLKEVLK